MDICFTYPVTIGCFGAKTSSATFSLIILGVQCYGKPFVLENAGYVFPYIQEATHITKKTYFNPSPSPPTPPTTRDQQGDRFY